jgi:hypothetical protein
MVRERISAPPNCLAPMKLSDIELTARVCCLKLPTVLPPRKASMTPEESDRLRELCMRAQSEMDPVKLVQLIQEINHVFEMSEQRLRSRSSSEQRNVGDAPKKQEPDTGSSGSDPS